MRLGGTIANAIHYGEILFLAVPYRSVEEVLEQALIRLEGRIVVDCTNPVIFGGEHPELAMGFSTSAAEQIAQMIPEAKMVKAYNTSFVELVQDGPLFRSYMMHLCFIVEMMQMQKKLFAKIIADTGFDPVDCGPLNSARLLRAYGCAISCALGYSMEMGREIAFKLLKRS